MNSVAANRLICWVSLGIWRLEGRWKFETLASMWDFLGVFVQPNLRPAGFVNPAGAVG